MLLPASDSVVYAALSCLHGGQEQFSRSLEKENDEMTKTYSRMTNCKDILGVLRSEKRREMARRNQAVKWHDRAQV